MFNLQIFIELQCSHSIMEKNQTAHMLTYFTKKTMVEHGQHLKTFILGHKDWIGGVGEKLLAKKGCTVDQYIADLVKPGLKFDEIALLCFAQVHYKHVYILMEGCFWTTRRDNDVVQCYLKFSYIGNLLFVPHMHESVKCRKFPDDTHVNLFLPKRCSLRQLDQKKTQKSSSETTIQESSLFDDKEAKLHSDLRECVNDVFEAILGQSPPHIPNGTIGPAPGVIDLNNRDQSGSVLKMPQNPSGSNDDHQDGTVVGTIWMDSMDTNENSENQNGTDAGTIPSDDEHQVGTANGTEQTDNAIAHMDITRPDSTVPGTDQTLETDLTLDNDAYNLELNQAVAAIEEPNKDTDDVNTPALPGLASESNESVHTRMENVNNTVGTMPTVDTAEINNWEEDIQGHAGIPGGTGDADTQAATLEPGNGTADVNVNSQPGPDSDSNVDNNNNEDNSSDTDTVHTSGCSTCSSSI